MARGRVKPWLTPGLDTGRDEIYYFPGCLPIFDELLGWGTSYVRAANAGVAILNHFGVSPKIVYGCCGHDLYYAGKLDHFELIRNRLGEEINGPVIAGCAECYHSLKELHGLDAIHISEFISNEIKDIPEKPIITTFHDPCRLGRFYSKYDQPREILKKISTFKEMDHSKENSFCCGISAWFNCNSVSKEIRVRRLNEAIATGAQILVTSCSKCRIHLECIFNEESYNNVPPAITILDFQELVADALGIDFTLTPMDFGEKGQRLNPVTRSKDFTKHLLPTSCENAYLCTTCERCKVECDFHHDLVSIIEQLRISFVRCDLNPSPHKKVFENVRLTGNVFGERTPFALGRENAEYVYFPGCVAAYRRPQLMRSTMSILDAIGVDYEIPDGLLCCGSVLKRTGYDLSSLAEKNKEIIGGRKVIVSCAGCYSTLARDYTGISVTHISQFLRGNVDKLHLKRFAAKVAYHDPCHLGRKMQVYEDPRIVLREIPGIELVEFSESRDRAMCCGGGGGVRSSRRDLAAELSKKRLKQAEELRVDFVVSACPFCELNLEEQGGLQVFDLVEIIAKALEGNVNGA
jgi:Fe-S oxidoreductase